MVDRIQTDNNNNPMSSTSTPSDEPNPTPTNDPTAAEIRKKAFEADQEARRQAFERDSTAMANKAQRDQDFAAAKAERDKKIAERRQVLLDMAFEHGVITHDDVMRRQDLLAPHAQGGALLPHDVFVDGEDTVLMAFPRTVILTLSANDVRRWVDREADRESYNSNVEDTLPSAIHPGSRVVFYQGYNDVPVDLADHSYLFDAGAYRAGDDGKPESAEARGARMCAARDKVRGHRGDDRRPLPVEPEHQAVPTDEDPSQSGTDQSS